MILTIEALEISMIEEEIPIHEWTETIGWKEGTAEILIETTTETIETTEKIEEKLEKQSFTQKKNNM